MKSFWTAVIIFSVMIMMIIANSLYMSKITTNLCEMLRNISEPADYQCIQQIIRFENYWKKHCNIIKLSTTSDEINSISSAIIKLKYLALELEESEFEVVRHQLLHAICNIRESEQLSLENII